MAVAQMAQPNAEPVEEYEYVLPQNCTSRPIVDLPIADMEE